MQIKFYKITDDRRKLNKTLTAGNLKKTLTGELKIDTDILNPILEVGYDADILTCNYMEIPALGRYYYIENITTSTQRLLVAGHVDVLQTYATSIRDLDCIVARQESDGNANFYLNDKMFRAHNFKIVKTIDFPSTPFMSGNNNVDSLVLTVGGGY